MAEIRNDTDYVVIDQSGFSVNESFNILNTGNNVTIYGSNPYSDYYNSITVDYINNRGSKALIYANGGKDSIVNYGANSSIDGGEGNDTITNYGDNSKITLGSGINTVNVLAKNTVINLTNGSQIIQSKSGIGTSIVGGVSNDIITIQNMDSNNGVVATINAGAGDDTINGSEGTDVFVYAEFDGNDVIQGWTSDDTIKLTSGSVSSTATTSGGDVLIAVGYDTITLKDAVDKKITIDDGINPILINPTPTNETAVTLESSFTGTYDDYDDTIKKIDASKVTSAIEIYGNDNDNTITGSSKNDTIYGGSGRDVLNGNSGNDELYGDDDNDKLDGGAGDDTLTGGVGADTLTGGAGKDIFYYDSGDGKDVITDYSASQGDLIQLGVSSISTSTSGNNVILKIDSGQINVKNGKSQKITVVGANGNSTVVSATTSSGSTSTLPSGLTYSGNKKTITAKSPFTGTIDLSKYSSTVTTVDAATDTKFVKVVGTSRAETLKAGKGGSILTGGKGNDKLYGGSGADTFTYANGDGKDTIYNYTSCIDTIKITSGTISKASVSGKNVILTVGSGSITVSNAKGKDINITDSNGETATYNFTSTVTNPTSRNYEERWFLDNSECVMRNSELDSIIKNNSELIIDYCNDKSLYNNNFSSILDPSSSLMQSKKK